MSIQNFPAALQPIIQHGFLEREFQAALTSKLGYRAVADREDFAAGIGETLTRTRLGPTAATTELYTLTLNFYATTADLNIVTSRVGIASQFLLNAAINGEQAARSLDELARKALYDAFDGGHGAILRPHGRHDTSLLDAADQLDMSTLLAAVATLRQNAVPEIDGAYNCYLDPQSARQLFNDQAFQRLFTGATSANAVYKRGMLNDFLGLRFVPTREAFMQTHPSIANALIRRPIVCGKGALIEGDFAGMDKDDVAPKDAIVSMVDNVAMVTREPIDRLQQIIAQSWYWIGGFAVPLQHGVDDTPFRRAVMIEHMG